MPLKNKLLIALTVVCSFLLFKEDTYVIPEAEPYYKEYMQLYKEYCPVNKLDGIHKLYIIHGKFFTDSILGLCYPQFNNQLIIINKIPFEYAWDNEKKAVIFHELNHCILGAEHTEGVSDLMAPYLPFISNTSIINQQIDIFKKMCNN